MQKETKRFKLAKFRFETDSGGFVDRFMITDNLLPMAEINLWIDLKSLRKTSTGKDYASKLVVFLNHLDQIGVEYDSANNKHVHDFIHNMIYGNMVDLKIKSMETLVTYSTLSKYVVVITELYKWLYNNYETNISFKSKTNTIRAQKSFMYGQIYTFDYQYIIAGYLPRLKTGREYTKWYNEDEKNRLADAFLSIRDVAVFKLTLEGFRIDEVLSMTLDSYNAEERMIQPTRSKGKTDVRNGYNPLRTVALPSDTCEILNQYIESERMTAENESGIISQHIFININKGRHQGRLLSYSNYLKVLKRCAKRATMNEAKIRTHNGRSTKAMEFLEHQALHSEDGISDTIIMESFGWNSIDSIKHYRDHNNQLIAKTVNDKLHSKRGGRDD